MSMDMIVVAAYTYSRNIAHNDMATASHIIISKGLYKLNNTNWLYTH